MKTRMKGLETALLDTFDSEEEKLIRSNLRAHNVKLVGDSHTKALLIACRDGIGELVAGLSGKTYFSWLYIDLLWVREDHRKKGLGTELLSAAEAEAVRRGCIGAHLGTYSFQALGFYEKLGYSEFGQLKDCPPGQTQYYLKKALSLTASPPALRTGP